MRKACLLVLKYWLFNIIIPALFLSGFMTINLSYLSLLTMVYIILFAPIVFFFLYYKKIKNQKINTLLISMLALLMPYIVLVTFIYFKIIDISVNLIPFG